ncbi:unnamed protein product [Rotaria sp. Silwood2]|nr:unnamed protein product [Rotaria sp. Silwood2]CAF2522141.1 unnamed protein product [Rotaria sp. Silwood2]CAF3940300.1 unnamed protein product [Rotaria sp. Silwood2]
MGNLNSSSSTSSSTSKNPHCYVRNKMMRQQYLRIRSNNEYIIPKPYLDNNCIEENFLLTQQSIIGMSKTHIAGDCQRNVIESDKNER